MKYLLDVSSHFQIRHFLEMPSFRTDTPACIGPEAAAKLQELAEAIPDLLRKAVDMLLNEYDKIL